MKKGRFRMINSIFAVLLCAALICGCTGGGAQPSAAPEPAPTTAAETPASTPAPTPEPAAEPEPEAAVVTGPEPITFTMWLGESWLVSITDPSFTDPTSLEITRQTGVTLDIQAARTDDSTQELNVILASGDLPDIFVHTQSFEPRFIAGEYVIPLDDLIDEYGPNFHKNMGHVLPYWRSSIDGNIYKVRGWVWNDPTYSLSFNINTLYMRYDILRDIGYPKLDRVRDDDCLITIEEYLGVLDQVKAMYPDMIPALIDLSQMNMTPAYDVMIMSTGTPIQEAIYEDGAAKSRFSSKRALESILFLNSFYNDGWVPKDISSYTRELFQALVATGEVFSTLGIVDGMAEAKSELSNEVDDRRMAKFYMTENSSVRHISANQYYIDGDCCLYISRSCKDPVRLMQFLDWCASDEGSLLLGAGTEGLTYNVIDGEIVPTDRAVKIYADWDATGLKELGIGPHGGGLPNFAGMTADGKAFDIFQQALFESDFWSIYDNRGWQHFADNGYSRAGIQTFDAETQNDAENARSNINTYASARIARAILAANAGAAQDEWDKCYQQMLSDGLEIVNQAYSDNWNTMAAMFSKEPALLLDIYTDLGIPKS